ncbi:MAG: SDR family NAD(P)-dependent oxidoreductase [Gammaproteobacteria bacterium]|jgi:short-subunit dehydrogenase
MDPIRDRVILLTGAGGGLGRAIAQRLAARGARLALAGRHPEPLAALGSELGTPTVAISADITDAASRKHLLERVQTELGAVDVLINNAGLEEITDFPSQDPELIRRIFETNTLGPVLLTRELLPEMLRRGRGDVVNIASLAGRTGMPFGAVYAGSKGALAEWSLSLYGELAGSGVRVSLVAPGFVADAGMFARKGVDAPRAMRACRPADVAGAVLRALAGDRPEQVVTPGPARLLMALRAIAPRLAMRVAARLGLVTFLAGLAAMRPGPSDRHRPDER